eukprot:scaffold60874_cov60-Phaeocystis_antarctica.AAC.1
MGRNRTHLGGSRTHPGYRHVYPGGVDGCIPNRKPNPDPDPNPDPNRGDHAQAGSLLVATAALHVVRLRGAPRWRARLRVG